MNKTSDVVIIGGGLIGSSIAFYTVKKGARVTVVEKCNQLGYGASGANQGACPLQLFSSPLLELVNESLKLYKDLSEEIACDFEYCNSGSLICSIDEEQYPNIERHYQTFREQGFNVRLIDGAEIHKLEPNLSRYVIAGVEEPDSCIVNPFKLLHGFANAAKKLGAEFILSTEVKNIETNNGRITSVVTDKCTIGTNIVVNAAGAWSPDIGKMLGLTIPVKAQRGQILVTDSVPLNNRWRYIIDADYLVTAFDENKITGSKDPRIKLGVAGSYVQANTGNWTAGSSRDFSGYNNSVTVQTLSYIANRLITYMPGFRDVRFIRSYAGFRPVCYADGLPILSKVDNPSGFIIATGHAGEGVVLAPITGKLISEVITEKMTTIPIDAFAFSRFKDL